MVTKKAKAKIEKQLASLVKTMSTLDTSSSDYRKLYNIWQVKKAELE